jgi:hypothetical protein
MCLTGRDPSLKFQLLRASTKFTQRLQGEQAGAANPMFKYLGLMLRSAVQCKAHAYGAYEQREAHSQKNAKKHRKFLYNANGFIRTKK